MTLTQAWAARRALPAAYMPAYVERAAPVRPLLLSNRYCRVGVQDGPDGGMVFLDWRQGKQWLPLMRPSAQAIDALSGSLACRPLLKTGSATPRARYSSQQRYDAAGVGSKRCWHVQQTSRDGVTLGLEQDGAAAYHLSQTIELSEASVRVTLILSNESGHPQTFGLGLACSLARESQTWLAAAADGIFCPGADAGAARWLPTPAAWSLGIGYPLPAATHQHTFTDWSGSARVHWPAHRVGLALAGDVSGYVLSLRADDDSFGFHPIECEPRGGARDRRRDAAAPVLLPGASVQREFLLRVEPGSWRPGGF